MNPNRCYTFLCNETHTSNVSIHCVEYSAGFDLFPAFRLTFIRAGEKLHQQPQNLLGLSKFDET